MRPVSILPQNFTCGSYQPVAEGVTLEPETGDRQASLVNLRRLVNSDPKRKVINFVKADGDIAVVFGTGEVYFALGFAESEELAEFAAEHYHGSALMWMNAATGDGDSDGELWPVPGGDDDI